MRPIKLFFNLAFALALLASAGAQTVVTQTASIVQGTVNVNVAATCKDSAGNLYETASSGVGQGSGASITEKLTPAGQVSWTNTFDLPVNYECFPYAVASGLSGDAYVFGYLRNDLDYTSSSYLMHINGSGDTLWHIITPNSTFPLGLTVDAAGNPIIELQTSKGFDFIKVSKTNGATIYNVPQTFTLVPQQGLSFVNDIYSDPAGYCYGIGQSGLNYFAVRFNEVTGAIMWNKPITFYGGLTKTTPAYGTVLSSGDFLVAGSATNAAGASVATLDRMSSAAGAFVYRSSFGVQADGYSSFFNCAPVPDNANQAYWSITEENDSTFSSANQLGKTTATGTTAWTASSGSGYSWLLAPSTSGGLFGAWSSSTDTNFIELSSTGAILWTDSAVAATVPSLYNGLLSVNTSNDLTLAGGNQDSTQDKCFGLLTLSGTNHAVLLNNYYKPDGDEDVRFSTSDQDAAGNTYFIETRNLERYVDKVSPTGTVWRTSLSSEAFGAQPIGICYSSLGYVAVLLNGSVSAIVDKLNASTGAPVWEKEFTYSVTASTYNPTQVVIDSLGNVDIGTGVVGTNSHGAPQTIDTQIDQFNGTNGTHAWTYSVPLNAGGGAIAVDPTGAVYAGGYLDSPSEFVLTKLTDAGSLIFSKTLAVSVNAGAVYYASNLFCDASGNTYLGISDADTSYNQTGNESLLHLASFNSAGSTRWQSTLTFAGYYEPQNLTFKENGGYLYFLSVIPVKEGDQSSFVDKLNPSTGALVWQNIHVGTPSNVGSLQEFSEFNFDTFGNPVVAGESIPLDLYIGLYDFVPGQAFVHKIDATTGATRWNTVSQGALTSSYNHITAVNVFPNNQIWALGQTPSSTGCGSEYGLSLHYASAPYCVSDSYSCVENTALSSTAASVLANDQDVSSATCAVVAGPSHAASFSLSSAGKIGYTPATGFLGTDTFTYKATTADGVSNTATVTITVKS